MKLGALALVALTACGGDDGGPAKADGLTCSQQPFAGPTPCAGLASALSFDSTMTVANGELTVSMTDQASYGGCKLGSLLPETRAVLALEVVQAPALAGSETVIESQLGSRYVGAAIIDNTLVASDLQHGATATDPLPYDPVAMRFIAIRFNGDSSMSAGYSADGDLFTWFADYPADMRGENMFLTHHDSTTSTVDTTVLGNLVACVEQ